MIVYIVEMLLKGNRGVNSYVLGAYSTYDLAVEAGSAEALITNNLYEMRIKPTEIDAITQYNTIQSPIGAANA